MAQGFEESAATVQGMEPDSVKLGQENGAWAIDSAMVQQEEEKKTGESSGAGLPVIPSDSEVYDLKASVPGAADMEGNGTGKGVPEADNTGRAMENPAEDVGQRRAGNGTEGEAVSGTEREIGSKAVSGAGSGIRSENTSETGIETQKVFRNGLYGDEKNAMEMAEFHRDVRFGTNEKIETAAGDSHAQALRPPHMASMCEDKWQQLQKIYPHIRPFQDEREYLSLRPEDFVILHSSAYQLVQNSFLLHGYFNYDHLILTQVSQRNGSQFYIGVPGNFFEKEKQVAIMYGFGSFECRQEPAQEGDFGYYMIKVEL